MPDFEAPLMTELTSLSGIGISARAQQQQQQQQQQQRNLSVRRYLNLETQLPEEEVVTKLTTEIKQINKVTPASD
jgi:hypothetical protein